MALTSCDNETTKASYVPGISLAERLELLRTSAESGGNYILDVSADESINPGQRLEYNGKNNITIILKGSGGNHTINLLSNGNMFVVRTGVTLVLDNITLKGRSFNSYPLVYIRSGGALQMINGASITGNMNKDSSGGGVLVEGTFTMKNGTISGNTTAKDGGGVIVSGGSFTMNGGTISGNNAGNGGGGVVVTEKGTFIMSNGTISGNIAKDGGGGVSVQSGNFTMSGGTLSSNNSEKDGGGVYLANVRNNIGSLMGFGNFIMSGGTISGNEARNIGGGVAVNSEGIFVMSNGSITGNTGVRGGGVSVALSTTFTMSGGTISRNTARTGGGGVYVEGVFSKTGGTITGYSSDRGNGNAVRISPGVAEIQNGHAVYAHYSGSKITKRKETTAGSEVSLSYTGRSGSFSGEWDY